MHKKLDTRLERKSIEVLGSVLVSKGKYTYPYLSLIKIGSRGNAENVSWEYITIQHKKGRMLNPSLIKDEDYFGSGKDFSWKRIRDPEDITTLGLGIQTWERNKAALVGYSFLVGFCLGRGLDLIEEGRISN